MNERAPLEDLIGTENCDYCNALAECISLLVDGEYSRAACLKCIGAAFDEHWGMQPWQTGANTNAST